LNLRQRTSPLDLRAQPRPIATNHQSICLLVAVLILSVIATIGLLTGLPHDIERHMAVVTLRQRIAVAWRPAILLAMLISAFALIAAMVIGSLSIRPF
jgi:hypothetical protein